MTTKKRYILVWLQKLHTALLLKPCSTPKAEINCDIFQNIITKDNDDEDQWPNNNVFFVQPMELPCDDTKKFSLESVPEKNPISSLFSRKFS